MALDARDLAGLTMQDLDDMACIWDDEYDDGKPIKATQSDIDMLYPVGKRKAGS